MDDTSQKLINLEVFKATNEKLKIYIDDEITNTPSKVVIDSILSATSKNPVENRIVTAEFDKYISKNGSTKISGNLEFTDAGVGNLRGIGGVVGSNDWWRIVGGATAEDRGFLEIATSDNGNEPIYVRQYTSSSKFNKLLRTATLLDESGNSIFPGTVTASRFIGTVASAETSLSADAITLINANEIRFKNKPSSEGLVYIGYKWSDGSRSPLISGYRFCNGDGSALASIYASDINGKNGVFSGVVEIIGAITASNTLTVNGLTTINSSLFVEDTTTFKEQTTHNGGLLATTGTFSSTFIASDNATFGKSLDVGGSAVFRSTEEATSSGSGAITIVGGLGVGKNIVSNGMLFVGNIADNAIIFLNNKEAFNGSKTRLDINASGRFQEGVYFGGSIVRTDGTLQVGENGATLSASNTAVIIKKETTISSNVSITKNTPSTSIATGALTVIGGIGTSGTISALKAQLGDKWRININPETGSLEMTYYG